MKPLLIAAILVVFGCELSVAQGKPNCTISMQKNIELLSPDFSLGDLLAPNTCPELLRAAVQVSLGKTPRFGSVRILDGAALRGMLERLLPGGEAIAVRLPERIRVYRAGERAACADIRAQIPASADGWQEEDCGAADRIARHAPLRFSEPAWNASLQRWAAVARCAHPGDCVPFLVQLSGPHAGSEMPHGSDPGRDATGLGRARAESKAKSAKPLLRPGQVATLLWDQDGIRFTGRVTCLDAGSAGEVVRARIAPGGRVVRAVVASPGVLRAGS